MRSVRYFNDSFTEKSVMEWIEKLEILEKVDLFIESNGGEAIATNIFLKFINQHPDIVLYMTGDIASSTTFLLLDFKGPIYLTKDLEFIKFHAIDRSLYVNRDRPSNKKLKAIVNSDNEVYYQKLRDNFLFTEAEINKLKKGQDLTIYQDKFSRFTIKNNIYLGN